MGQGSHLRVMLCVFAPWVVALTLFSSVASAAADDPSARLAAVVEGYFEAYLELNPGFATSIGDYRFNDRLAIAIAPEHRRLSRALETRALEQATALSPEELGPEDLVTREIFIRERRLAIEGHRYPDHLMPVDQLHSPPVVLAMLGGGGSVQPFRTVADYENWLGRLASWPRWVDQAIANMDEGMATGIVLPRPVVERVLPLLAVHLVTDPRESVFYGPIERLPATFDGEDRERLETAYLAAISKQVIPGYRRLLEFMHGSYLPKTRATVGLADLPGGADWYAYRVRAYTTTGLTPVEIHKIGKREVSRLTGAMERLERLPLVDPRAAGVTAGDRLIDGYRALRARVEPRLPELFATLPAADFEIRPVEAFRRASAAGASYLAGLPDGSRPGCFYVNADEATAGEASDALFLHEAIPGHHFQISLQREREELPRFRRFGSTTAYVEGWALYAESLGEALGLYRSRGQRLRALRSELFRARRLVVDTGLHAMGWSREEAIRYLGSPREVDRYIAWPGQALAYKIGELRISELRETAEKRLGKRFDLRQFHDLVLSGGAMPLDLLDARVEAWIAECQVAAGR